MNTRNIIIILVTIFAVIVAIYFIWNKNAKQPELAPATTTMLAAPQTTKMEKQGVQVEILKEGAGAIAKKGDTVSAHYVGTLENGTKFDSSVDRGTPFEFSLGAGQVIPGWDIGVEGMKVGEVRRLGIPSALAYGSRGAGEAIPQNSNLIFEVQLLGIK